MTDRRRTGPIALALALALASVAVGVPVGGVQQGGGGQGADGGGPGANGPAGPTVIDSCTVIDEPGRYVLGADLKNVKATEDAGVRTPFGNASACLVISSDDVFLEGGGHVVDGRGFPATASADGDGSDGTALGDESLAANGSVDVAGESDPAVDGAVSPAGVAAVAPGDARLNNVTVTNLTATDWFVGVLGARLSGATVWGVNASGNADVGIELLDLTNSAVANATASENGFAGVYASGGGNNTVSGVVARNNSVAGIDLSDSDDDLLWRNRVAGNGVAGIALVGGDRTRLADNALADTRGNDSVVGFSGGLVLVDARDVVASNTTAAGNRRWTVYATAGSKLSMENLRAGGRAITLMGRDFALGRSAAVGEGDVSSVGSGLVVTNTSESGSTLTIGVDWTGDGTPATGNETTVVGNETPIVGAGAARPAAAPRFVAQSPPVRNE